MEQQIDWNLVGSLIDSRLICIVVMLWCLGFFLKRMPAFKQEWQIPFILMVVSILMVLLYMAFVLGEGITPAVMVVAIIQGILCAAAAVFSNELLKQAIIKRQEDYDEDK